MSNYLGKLQQMLCLLTCVLMVVAVSIRRDGKVVGRNVKNQQTVSQKADPMVVLDDGSALLNTSELGKDIVGYGGNVPLEITLREGRVEYPGTCQFGDSRFFPAGFCASYQMEWSDHRRRTEDWR